MPRVAVVIPTRNRSALLARSIRALAAQTYGDFSVTVYDNASTDATEETVRTLASADPRIRYHRHAANIGAYGNFLFAAERADGELVAMLSDDDVPLPSFLAANVAAFDRCPGAGFTASGTVEMTPDGSLVHVPLAAWERDGAFDGAEGVRRLLDGNHPSWNTILFARSAIDAVGLPDPDLGLVFDLEFTLRIAARFPYVVDRRPTGVFVRHGASSTEFADAAVADAFDAAAARFAAASDLAADVREAILHGLAALRRERLAQVAVKLLLRGEVAQAREALRRGGAQGGAGGALAALAPALGTPLGRRALGLAAASWQQRRSAAARRAAALHGVPLDEDLLVAALRR